MKQFEALRIVEIAGSAAGAYTAKMFADHGATVIKVEPLGGDPLRSEGEPWTLPNGDVVGTTWAYLNTSKHSIFLDLSDHAGLVSLLAGADAVIESSSPEPLISRTDIVNNERLVRTHISPFGSSGPYSNYRSNLFTDEAIGGQLYPNGEPSREPIRRPGLHMAYQAGTHGFIGTMAALRVQDLTGRGQVVEIAHFEGSATLHQHTTTMWTHGGHILKREGNRQPGSWHPVGVYPCRDGYVQLSLASGVKLMDFLALAGLTEIAEDPRFKDDYARGAHKDEFDEVFIPWLMEHTAEEIIAIGRSVFAPVGPVPTMLELLDDPQLAFREYWQEINGNPPLQIPRGPFWISDRDPDPQPPSISDGSISWSDDSKLQAEQNDALPTDGPLEGIRILDLTRVWAGPWAGRMLGDLGADVISIEALFNRGPRDVPDSAAFVSHLYPENEIGERPWNRFGGFNKLHRNRRSVTLNFRDERGRELFAELVAEADIVIENFSPRVMPQLGFDFERLKKINPSIIYAAMPGYGSTGPDSERTALGPLIEAGAGLSSMMGYLDTGPYRSGIAWPDPVAGMNSVSALLIALRDREADPNHAGRSIEIAMIEAMGSFVGEELLGAQIRGKNRERMGNRDPFNAPQGVYPCAGDDRWIAISVTSNQEWRALAALADLGSELTALTREDRHARHEELDTLIANYTRSFSPHPLMARLQAAGIIAAVVSDARDLVEDRQLAERDFWAELPHPDVGLRRYPGNGIRLELTPVTYRRTAPTLGQHNDEILGGLLGTDREALEILRRDGVIGEIPPAN